MWGQYPALIEGPPGAVVQGVAYEVQTAEAATKLATYETDAYVEHACVIQIKGGDKVSGMIFIFKWRDDPYDEDPRPVSGKILPN